MASAGMELEDGGVGAVGIALGRLGDLNLKEGPPGGVENCGLPLGKGLGAKSVACRPGAFCNILPSLENHRGTSIADIHDGCAC